MVRCTAVNLSFANSFTPFKTFRSVAFFFWFPRPTPGLQLRDYLRMLINEDGVLIDVEDVAKRPVHAAVSNESRSNTNGNT